MEQALCFYCIHSGENFEKRMLTFRCLGIRNFKCGFKLFMAMPGEIGSFILFRLLHHKPKLL